ncbi:Cell wall protein [Yarrowia sp. B02]|nr:Cell wall protein [Yarrowia sp. B02]
MKYTAATLLFAAAASALDVVTDGSKPFGIMSLRSASAIHLSSVGVSGDALAIGSDGATFTIKDGVLYANDKAVDFSSGEAKIAEDGKGTSGVSLEKGYVTVPGFSWAGCPQDSGYAVDDNSKCEDDGIPFGAYAVAKEGESGQAASSEEVKTSAAVPSTAVVAPASSEEVKTSAAVPTSALVAPPKPSDNSGAVVTQIGDGQIQAPPSAPPAAPEQANGAAALGVSAAAFGVAAAALLI